MGRSIRLGSLSGIGIYVHWSFFLLPAWVFFEGLASGQALSLTALVLVIFGCVLLHEMGHALMARRFGIATRDITLTPIGGIARLSRMTERAVEEFWIALAGPAVNVAIAAGLALLLTSSTLEETLGLVDGLVRFLWSLLAANVVLVVFNLLPAFPMDGGRVLRALLTRPLGAVRATEVAATLGLIMAGVFVVLGLLSMVPGSPVSSPLLVIVGPFVYLMGQHELAAVRAREARRRRVLLEALPVAMEPAPEADFSGFTWDRQARLWIRWHGGRPIEAMAIEPE